MIEEWGGKIPKDLLASFKSSTPPIIFVGAGFGKESVPPLKTGNELSQDIIAELGVSSTGEGLSELLQYLQNEYAGSKRNVIAWIKERLLHGSSSPGGAHRLLLELPCSEFVTTNYDSHLIESSRQIPSYTLVPIDDPGSFATTLEDIRIGEKKAVLARLHGAFENEATIVATTDDYISSYTSSGKWPDLLREMFRNRRVIFVGYSMRDFTTWTSYISVFKSWNGSMLPHAIVAPSESRHLNSFWSHYGIQYIPLKAHQFLIAVHDYLNNLETQEAIAVAAAAACTGKTYSDMRQSLERIQQESTYPTLLLAALKVVESSYD